MTGSSLSCVVLAAGQGTRMVSARPKPLHRLCGRAMVLHILDGLAGLEPSQVVVVVGHGAEQVTKALVDHGPAGLPVTFVEQIVQRGTGDALMVALGALADDEFDDDLDEGGDLDGGDVLVVPGDAPLLRTATLERLVRTHRGSDAAATLLSARMPEPRGYGRVVRGRDNRVVRIVEEVEATPDEAAIDEVATSIYCFRRSLLAPALRRLSPQNRKGEYYLTDVIAVLAGAGYPVSSMLVDDPAEAVGVNDRVQLAEAEAELRRRINRRWMAAGVTMVDPERTYIDTGVHLEPDVTLFPGVVLAGATVVGPGAVVGPDSHLIDCVVGPGARVVQTVATDAEIGAGAHVGPFAHLPAGAVIAIGQVTGAFYTASRR